MAFGEEANSGLANIPGTYRDPESGAELEVKHPAGADALVRMGWEPVGDTAVQTKAIRGPRGQFLPRKPVSAPGPDPDAESLVDDELKKPKVANKVKKEA